MFKFMPYLLKTLWRHRARTMLTVSGSAVALFVFCFVGSVQEGLDRLTSQKDSTLIVFQANKFCPATSHLPQDYDQIIGKMPGVREVVPIQVFTNNHLLVNVTDTHRFGNFLACAPMEMPLDGQLEKEQAFFDYGDEQPTPSPYNNNSSSYYNYFT